MDGVNVAQWICIKFRGGGLSGILLVAVLMIGLPCPGRAGTALPAVSEVLRRMIERAQMVAQADRGPQYTYEKRSLLERLDSTGQPIDSEEKLYQVTLISGIPFNRLVKIQGRELDAEEANREEAREERFRQRFVSADRKKLVTRKEALVTPELLDRFQFAVKDRVVLSNRATLVLTFKPKEGNLPAKTAQDKLLNGMAGTLWIDEGDADTARLVVNLVEPVSLGWFGWLGSLNRCELSLERLRMPDGVWINRKQALLIHCRKLAASQRFRTIEESQGFRRVEAKQ
ncbi:MAG: hypothetical protein NT154_35900 [Verrucomicrobia bacterium]|nr:hypothetical protein [Verrucomicrobiota bacterium]